MVNAAKTDVDKVYDMELPGRRRRVGAGQPCLASATLPLSWAPYIDLSNYLP
jgi:hypothetical protein